MTASFDLDRAPSDAAWPLFEVSDDNANWARRRFAGLTGRQAWEVFSSDILDAGECINAMPDEAFKYYIVALALYVDQLDFKVDDGASAAVNCLFGYLKVRGQSSPGAVRGVADLVRPTLLALAANQRANDMPAEIYGDLSLRAHAILSA